MSSCSYYDVLGIDDSASAELIRRRYKALALRYHPDKGGGDDTTKRMIEINTAYSILGDPGLRMKYDRMHQSDPTLVEKSSAGAGVRWVAGLLERLLRSGGGLATLVLEYYVSTLGQTDASAEGLISYLQANCALARHRVDPDSLANFVRRLYRALTAPKSAPAKGNDIEIRLRVPLASAYKRKTANVPLRRPRPCVVCRRLGKIFRCGECGTTSSCPGICLVCVVPITDSSVCEECQGKGHVIEESSLCVPLWCDSDYPGRGAFSGNNLAAGDVRIRVAIDTSSQESSEFEIRNGHDLLVRRTIGLYELLYGTRICLTLPDDRSITFTRHGPLRRTLYQVSGYGLPTSDDSRGKILIALTVTANEESVLRMFPRHQAPAPFHCDQVGRDGDVEVEEADNFLDMDSASLDTSTVL